MDTLFIPTESDFHKWVKEAVKECLEEYFPGSKTLNNNDEPLLSRKEAAGILNISLVTLHDWMKRGLPFHKQRGRVYLIRSEVLDYIKAKRMRQYTFSKRFMEVEGEK